MVDAYAEPRWNCLRFNNLREYENSEVSQFIDTGSRLLNSHNMTNIIFLDEAKRIIFET